jgi:ABC-type multidrug transport system permease subunit
MTSYFLLSNDSSSSGEASLKSLGCPLGSSEESYFTNSRKVALLDSPHPRELPKSLLFSIFEEQQGLKYKRTNDGSFREDYDDNRSPTAAESQKSSIFGVCANLVNSMAGGGIVGIPYAFKLSGFLTGVYLLILTATLSGNLVCVLLQLAHVVSFHFTLFHFNLSLLFGYFQTSQ